MYIVWMDLDWPSLINDAERETMETAYFIKWSYLFCNYLKFACRVCNSWATLNFFVTGQFHCSYTSKSVRGDIFLKWRLFRFALRWFRIPHNITMHQLSWEFLWHRVFANQMICHIMTLGREMNLIMNSHNFKS